MLTAQPEEDEGVANATTQLHVLIFDRYALTIHEKPIRGLDLLVKRLYTEYELESIAESLLRSSRSASSLVSSGEDGVHNIIPSQSSTSSLYKYETPTSIAKLAESSPSKYTLKPVITSPDWILFAFLDGIVDIYIPIVTSISHEVDHIDELVTKLANSEQKEVLQRMGLANRTIIHMKRLLVRKQQLADFMVLSNTPFMKERTKVRMKEVVDHLEWCLERLESAKDALSHTASTHMMHIQVEIARAASRTASFINRFSFYGGIAAPIMLIISWFGMNVRVPGQEFDNLTFFFGILAFMMILAIGLLIVMRKYRRRRIYR